LLNKDLHSRGTDTARDVPQPPEGGFDDSPKEFDGLCLRAVV